MSNYSLANILYIYWN